MTRWTARKTDLRLGLAWLALAWALLSALGGCTTPASPSSSSSREMLTESDEPESRKRARIRMELAIGYFEQGQTSVALDEVKQVIASDPTFPDAYNLRGLIYMRLGDL